MQRTRQCAEPRLAGRQVPLCPRWPLPRPCCPESRLNTSLPCKAGPNHLLHKPCEPLPTAIRSLRPGQSNVPGRKHDPEPGCQIMWMGYDLLAKATLGHQTCLAAHQDVLRDKG